MKQFIRFLEHAQQLKSRMDSKNFPELEKKEQEHMGE